MRVLATEVRPGAYHDSIVLMQLQRVLTALPGILDAAVVMGNPANRELLDASGLLTAPAAAAGAGDLVVVVAAADEATARAALARLDALLTSDREHGGEYRPRSLASAARTLPAARWVGISVPGRYAAELAGQALDLGLHVFLYSDNVTLDEEAALKRRARAEGRLVMGPDCGTALVGGVGLGFANRVRRGNVGIVGASGTGIQAVAARLDALGAGVSHALGTGGRDLSAEVGGITALQALDLLRRDPATEVVVLLSKPPAPAVARTLLAAARRLGKPTVIHFLGAPPPGRRLGRLHFAASLADAAELAAGLGRRSGGAPTAPPPREASPPAGRYLRGLFTGGTLAYEALLALRAFLAPLAANLALDGVERVSGTAPGRGHTLLDLGADELTVGRPHPMVDAELRLRRMRQEAADPEVGVLLLDLVLGFGAHPDPAAELAGTIATLRRQRPLEVVVALVGTDEDPQDLVAQAARLEEAGAVVRTDLAEALKAALARLPAGEPEATATEVPLDALAEAPAVLNAGLEIFQTSLEAQGALALHLDWRPPAGGDERLRGILSRLRAGAGGAAAATPDASTGG